MGVIAADEWNRSLRLEGVGVARGGDEEATPAAVAAAGKSAADAAAGMAVAAAAASYLWAWAAFGASASKAAGGASMLMMSGLGLLAASSAGDAGLELPCTHKKKVLFSCWH